jgi:hypothetical protein
VTFEFVCKKIEDIHAQGLLTSIDNMRHSRVSPGAKRLYLGVSTSLNHAVFNTESGKDTCSFWMQVHRATLSAHGAELTGGLPGQLVAVKVRFLNPKTHCCTKRLLIAIDLHVQCRTF